MEPRHADVLLVGGGVAAARCARTLRRGGFGGTIVLVGEEELPPYNRPPLSKEVLRDEVPEELLLAEPRSWYERRGVDLRLGTPVVALDPGERLVELADGTRFRYGGACLLATGAAPRVPNFPANVLRTLGDARALREAASSAPGATVVGGGFIGVEVAASLAARGLRTQLLCGGDRLWGGAFGTAASDWATGVLQHANVDVRFHADPDATGELVVAGMGVDPRVELAVLAELDVDDGILVDASQATSGPDIYAAGDVARLRDRPRVEHWHAARESGERAALAILGQRVPAVRAPWIYSELGGAKLDAVGWPSADAVEVEAGPGVIGFAHEGVLVQVVILDGAMPVEPVRSLVEGGARPADLVSRA